MMEMTDILAAARWWLVLMVLGAAATPLTAYFLQRLPDRGYAFTKMIGLLLVSFIFWLLGNLGFWGNNVGSILLSLLIVIALSVWALYRLEEPLSAWLKANRQHILITELVFLVIFALWVWVRAQNPTIQATEKPMEFAFLNGVGRSSQFPPLDPWLSGYSISYYYFGYVMTSVLARLSAVAEPVAFNLGIAWLVAGSGIGAFGLVYNLIAASKKTIQQQALGFAIVAAFALPLAGNGQMFLELLHANGTGSPEFWAWLDVRDINTPAVTDPNATPRYTSFWWWWRSSRVIHEYTLSGRAEEGLEPIAEFPGFSFILGDMHPHVLALPFAFVSLAVAMAWWLQPGLAGKEWDEADGRGRVQLLLEAINPPFLLFTGVVLGGLSFLNTWDVLIHLFVVAAAFALAQWRDNGWHTRILWQTGLVALLLVLLSVVLYFPFYLGFSSQAGPPFILPMLMRPTRLAHFLIIFGLPLLVIAVFLGTLVVQQKRAPWKIALFAGGGLVLALILIMLVLGWVIAVSPAGMGTVINLANELGRPITAPLPETSILGRVGWGFTAVASLVPAVLGARLAYPGVTLLLATLIGLIVMWYAGVFSEQSAVNREPSGRNLLDQYPALPFVLLMVLTGALLTLGPEYLYLKDNFSQRLNTVFKFYYQAWVMFGAAAIVALHYLLREVRVAGLITGVVYTLGLAIALLFPYYAVTARAAEYRGDVNAEFRRPPTLNGLISVQNSDPDEYAALLWLRDNVPGEPVILEAVGGAYSNYGRVSASTGLPTVIGWANHEWQWRGSDHPEPGPREKAVPEMYNNPDWATVRDMLTTYQVEYVYVGSLERSNYSEEGLAKFAQYMDVAYQNNSVIIYRWQPGESEE